MAVSPLHLCHSNISSAIFNRSFTFFHSIALLAFISYRLSLFLIDSNNFLPHFMLFLSELLLSLIWLCSQAFLWRPVSRTLFLENFPENKDLPAIDVFICTSDPKKEPPLEVMNTVLSALALDYPPEKLSVYVSDDGGYALTLAVMRSCYEFAKDWICFCTRFGILNRCPKVYFSSSQDDVVHDHNLEYQEHKHNIKRKYEKLKESIEREESDYEYGESNNNDHSSTIEVIQGKSENEVDIVPQLVYVSREKKSNYSHHFKAGALNVLLRISGMMTNAPYILVLDCDMFCNDSKSARQAMCFFLDSRASPWLAFVQFPQKFHNITKSDIYDSQLRAIFTEWWPGLDGLQGPILSGTCFYMKRDALYGHFLQTEIEQLKQTFGQSNDCTMSNNLNAYKNRDFCNKSLKEAHFLANVSYEEHTLWGEQVGFLYESVVEDYFTGFLLQCKGWTSVLCNPSRPAFLGSGTTNLNDTLVQNTRWNCGLMEVTMSRFFPLIYGISRMSLLQNMCYTYFALQPLYSFPLWCFATIPQLCLFKGIPIYPKVSSSWFFVLSFIFVGSSLKQLQEVLSSGGNVENWWNEQRIWMIKSVTAYTYGSLDAILKMAGARKASFVTTNKASDDGKITLYKKGKFDFRTTPMLLAPIVSLVILNIVTLFGGIARVCKDKAGSNLNEMFGQILLSFYIIVVNFPVVEGMLWRKDEGRIPVSVCLLSVLLSVAFLCVGYMAF